MKIIVLLSAESFFLAATNTGELMKVFSDIKMRASGDDDISIENF